MTEPTNKMMGCVMDKYLKMADVFADSAKKGTNLVCGKTIVAKFVDGVECEYSVHAINSHDELVQINQELLAALELVINDKAPSYHDCIDDGESECAWCVARKAINKARGE